MSLYTKVVIAIIACLGYLGAPATVIWGWVRWGCHPKQRTATAILSLSGLCLATASGLVAVSTIAYAQAIHGFRYYDPLLIKIFRTGMLLSLAGIASGMGGVWRSNALRWLAPISGVATLAFWIGSAMGE